MVWAGGERQSCGEHGVKWSLKSSPQSRGTGSTSRLCKQKMDRSSCQRSLMCAAFRVGAVSVTSVCSYTPHARLVAANNLPAAHTGRPACTPCARAQTFPPPHVPCPHHLDRRALAPRGAAANWWLAAGASTSTQTRCQPPVPSSPENGPCAAGFARGNEGGRQGWRKVPP